MDAKMCMENVLRTSLWGDMKFTEIRFLNEIMCAFSFWCFRFRKRAVIFEEIRLLTQNETDSEIFVLISERIRKTLVAAFLTKKRKIKVTRNF